MATRTAGRVTLARETPPRTVDEAELREVVSELAAIYRPSASEGERQAAELIAARLERLGCKVTIDEESGTGGYWWSVGTMSAVGTLAGIVALSSQRRRRKAGRRGFDLGRLVGVLGGAAAVASLADDASAGPLWFRHRFLRYRPTWNLTAETGDPSAADTIVILGHHDAAHSGLLFHPAVPKWMHEHMRKQVESAKQSTPYWVGIVGAPALVTLGSLIGTPVGRMMTRLGTALGAAWSALIVDIGNRDAVPGANDNLSATAVQVHLARALRDRPIKALRVLLVSCGSEETLQEGILAYAQRHFPDLDPERTHFLTIDTVGSGHLFMAEGEGTLKVREFSPEFKELIADTAQASDIDLQRGISARSSTDACVPLRAGYPTALLASLDDHRALANYHWPTDTAENLDYGCVADCAALLEAVIRRAAIQMEHSE